MTILVSVKRIKCCKMVVFISFIKSIKKKKNILRGHRRDQINCQIKKQTSMCGVKKKKSRFVVKICKFYKKKVY